MNGTFFFIFHNDDILLERLEDGRYTIPYGDEPPVKVLQEYGIMNVTTSDGTEVKAYETDINTEGTQYGMCGLRASYYKLPADLYRKAGKCRELLYWNKNTLFCGACGGRMMMSTDISKKCKVCGKEIWPQLATAIIVLIHKGDEVLLVHARNFRGNFFGLVAGFVETGETLEEAVHREVLEETGIKIKNIRYFGSQPWPYPCGLMVGFNADYDNGDIHLQESEITNGAWFKKDNLPEIPEKLSIARRLIDNWLECI